MPKSLEGERHFLIAALSPDRRRKITEAIQAHVSRPHFTVAADGNEAMSKAQNFQPHILVTDLDLARVSGCKLVEWTLQTFKDSTACIILSAAPDKEQFVDEVVIGRVQFLDDFSDAIKLSKALSRALNYLASENPHQFKLKFLAPGEILVKQGDAAQCVYILKRGQLQATTKVNQENFLLGLIEEGEFVGEMAYINGERRSADVTATSDCELIEVPIDLMDHMLFQKPAWSKALMATLSRRVKKTNEARAKV